MTQQIEGPVVLFSPPSSPSKKIVLFEGAASDQAAPTEGTLSQIKHPSQNHKARYSVAAPTAEGISAVGTGDDDDDDESSSDAGWSSGTSSSSSYIEVEYSTDDDLILEEEIVYATDDDGEEFILNEDSEAEYEEEYDDEEVTLSDDEDYDQDLLREYVNLYGEEDGGNLPDGSVIFDPEKLEALRQKRSSQSLTGLLSENTLSAATTLRAVSKFMAIKNRATAKIQKILACSGIAPDTALTDTLIS